MLYEYQPDRKQEHPQQFLTGFQGYLHTDGYSGYHNLPENITVVGCWAHARRKFDEAMKSLPKGKAKNSSAAQGLAYEDIQFRNMSESTHKNYTHNIKKFFAFCNKPLEELDEMDVRRFLRHLIQEKNLAPATVNQYGASIRFFFAVSLNRTMNYLQIPLMKVPKTLPDILTREEVHALINVCTNTKHRALLLLAYGSGLRSGEIETLRVKDIDSKERTLTRKK